METCRVGKAKRAHHSEYERRAWARRFAPLPTLRRTFRGFEPVAPIERGARNPGRNLRQAQSPDFAALYRGYGPAAVAKTTSRARGDRPRIDRPS